MILSILLQKDGILMILFYGEMIVCEVWGQIDE
jgi:hypothetical protein